MDDHASNEVPNNPLQPPQEAKPQGEGGGSLRAEAIDVLQSVYDPEIPVNIWELGLIYKVEIENEKDLKVQMTLTTPACPVAGSLPGEVEMRLKTIEGIGDVQVELVWDPPWDKDMMSEAAKLQLGFL